MADLPESEIRKNYQLKSKNNIELYKFPGELFEEEYQEALEYIDRLKEYFQDAADNGNAMIKLFY